KKRLPHNQLNRLIVQQPLFFRHFSTGCVLIIGDFFMHLIPVFPHLTFFDSKMSSVAGFSLRQTRKPRVFSWGK
ncbi:MAG TPA: hypothetical protein PLN81_09095, partial [Bacillota bacterium]|nr:hypothetical protein [Bacillota bacterium]